MWRRSYNSISRVGGDCINIRQYRHNISCHRRSNHLPSRMRSISSLCDVLEKPSCCSHHSINNIPNNQRRDICTYYTSLVKTSNRNNNINGTIQQHSSSIISKRYMSDEIRRGTDLLADSLAHGSRRKIILESYAPSGVDVKGLVKVGGIPSEGDLEGEDKIIHMNGSIVAFPDACFLWNVKHPDEVTLESLEVVRLYQPTVEYLFIGCDKALPSHELNRIKKEFRKREIVTEQMDIMNAMGTFNILNGEDRRVSCVLVIDPNDGS